MTSGGARPERVAGNLEKLEVLSILANHPATRQAGFAECAVGGVVEPGPVEAPPAEGAMAARASRSPGICGRLRLAVGEVGG
jgi:hypothetical protein